MKIEKGKLYYNIQDGVVEMPMSDMKVDEGVLTDKIAVHCPTKDDWDYVIERLNLTWAVESHFSRYKNIVIYIHENLFGCLDYVDNKYIVITIDQFKQFYPEDKKELSLPIVDHSNVDNIIEILKIQTQLDFSIESIERELERLKKLKQQVDNILK